MLLVKLPWACALYLASVMQVIGKVAQTGAERILGTFVGGSLGFLTYIVGRTFWSPDTRSDGVSMHVPCCIHVHGMKLVPSTCRRTRLLS